MMKRVVVVLITLALLSLCNGDDLPKQVNADSIAYDRKTPAYETIEEFGSQVFEFIKSGKFDKILELQPNLNEFTAIINNSYFPDLKKKETISKAENHLKNNTESLKKSYDLFIENTKSAGVDWSDYCIEYIDYKHQKRNKIEDADIYLYISSNSVNYKIALHDCLRTEGTWLMGNEIYWKVPK